MNPSDDNIRKLRAVIVRWLRLGIIPQEDRRFAERMVRYLKSGKEQDKDTTEQPKLNISEEAQQAADHIHAKTTEAIISLVGYEPCGDNSNTRRLIAEVIQSAIDTATERLTPQDINRVNAIDTLLDEGDRLELWVEDGGVIISKNGKAIAEPQESVRKALDAALSYALRQTE